MKLKIERAQKFLKEEGIDGWLLYDFHKSNELAHQFLEIPSDQMTTRRFFYWIPKDKEPIKLVHAIESHILDNLPGEKRTYLSWQSLQDELKKIIIGKKKVAMEYSFENQIPYVSKVDAGTVDLIRNLGVEVVSSANFLGHFTSLLEKQAFQSHLRASSHIQEIVEDAWNWISTSLKEGKAFSEFDVQQRILKAFDERKLVTDSPPIVAVNKNSADPHYMPTKTKSSPIKKGDFILIDLWAKEAGERKVFADITRVAVAKKAPSEKETQIFEIVLRAQKAGIDLLKLRFSKGEVVYGYEVDDAVRNVIESAGFGPYFLHRTGHSIEFSLHGSGTHLDNLEIHDARPILKESCFSIEPGIYLAGEFGIRLETDIFIDRQGNVEVTGGLEESLLTLL